MDWHAVVGIVAGVIHLGVIVPYLLAMVKGTTRPNIISWFLWTVIQGIIVIAQFTSGASWSIVIPIASGIGNCVVLAFAIAGYGYKRFEAVDVASLLLAAAAMIFWALTSNPLTAILCAVLADAISYVPTLFKTYRDRYSETAVYWAGLVTADLLALVATTRFDLANILVPISYGVMNTLVVLLCFFGKEAKK